MNGSGRDARLADSWERFSSGPVAVAFMFTWAFAEAIFWPIIADIPLAALAAGTRRPARLIAATVAGMATGGILLFVFARAAPEAAGEMLERLPLVSDAQVQRAEDLYDRFGIASFVLQPVTGVPFKVLGLEAGTEGASWAAITLFIAARGARMLATGLVACFIGRAFKAPIRRRFRVVAIAYVAAATAGWMLVTF